MDRLFSWILLLLLLFNLNGVPVAFRMQQKLIRREIKHAIKRRLKEDELTPFKFSKEELADLDWVRDHEFRLGAAMYDVVQRKPLSVDSVQLWCLNDVQEARLFENLDQWTRNNLLGEKGLMHLWNKFIHFWLGVWMPGISNSFTASQLHQRTMPGFLFAYREPSPTLHVPPPRQYVPLQTTLAA